MQSHLLLLHQAHAALTAVKRGTRAHAEKLSFILRLALENLLFDILSDSQLVIFSYSTLFIVAEIITLFVWAYH